MVCRNCKKNIPDQSELCPECGAKISSFDASASPEIENKGRDKHKTVSSLIIALITLFVAGCLIVPALITVNTEDAEKKAQRYIEIGDYQRAVNEYRNLLKKPGKKDEQKIRENLREIYIEWFEEVMDDEYATMQDVVPILTQMLADDPNDYEEVDEMTLKAFQRFLPNIVEKYDFYIPGTDQDTDDQSPMDFFEDKDGYDII